MGTGGLKNLIVNADDLGWTTGVNRGIVEAHRRGLVTSTSLLANGPAFSDGVSMAKSNPDLGVGVHLNLSDGPPTAAQSKVKGLLNQKGVFEAGPESLLLRLAKRSIRSSEVEREWDAQIQKVRDAGIHPTHIDGHKHVHMLPGLFDVALRLAKQHGIGAIRVAHEDSQLRAVLSAGKDQKARVILKQGIQARGLKLLAHDAKDLARHAGVATTDYFCGITQTGVMMRGGVERMLEILPDGYTELMCHPGYVDEELLKSDTRLQQSRQTEIAILTDAGLRKLVATRGIRLLNFKNMAVEG
jgi:predicted glycoside hydrolase/deacetylase ChbG (UPF0249 family)